MPRGPRIRAKLGEVNVKSKPSHPNGDDFTPLNSSELRKVDNIRLSEGKPPIDIKQIIEVFAAYLKKTKIDLKPFGFKRFSEWVEAMLEHVRLDTDNTWVFVVEGDKAVAFASSEVLEYTVRATRSTSKVKGNKFLYIGNLCSLVPGWGSKALTKLVQEQILDMRGNGVKGDITVMLNFTPSSTYLAAYYSKLGFKFLSKLSSPKVWHCAKVIKDPVHSEVMYKTFRGV